MKIGIYNLEPHIKNLALEKIRHFHQSKGDLVVPYSPIEQNDGFDKVYVSSIFDWTDKGYISPNMIFGGSGFDLNTILPPEIEATEPHINMGYTTRGCIHNCPFCIVREKEGYIKATGDTLALWDGKSQDILYLDNNPLALLDHFSLNCEQLRRNNLRADWNQGLDHRLLTLESLELIQSVRHKELRFAFDYPQYINSVERVINLLQSKGINRCSWYVLVGFNTTLKEDLFRLNYLRERNQIAYVQRYKSKKRKPEVKRDRIELIALARWANQHHLYRAMTWEQFLLHPANKAYRHLLELPVSAP